MAVERKEGESLWVDVANKSGEAGRAACAELMHTLAIPMATLPATTPEMVKALRALEDRLIGEEPVAIPTEHVIHAGMYARTIAIPKDTVLTGALIKRATLVIVTGAAAVLVGEEWLKLEGYNVLPASAGRKQVFVSYSPVVITMLFPTEAKTVEEAEREFTDEADRLLSRRQDANIAVITEDRPSDVDLSPGTTEGA